MTKRASPDHDTALMRALATGLDDRTLLALQHAALAQAAVFDVVAIDVPEQRDDAKRLRAMALLSHRTIIARGWIKNEKGTDQQ